MKRRRDCTCFFVGPHARVNGFGLEVHRRGRIAPLCSMARNRQAVVLILDDDESVGIFVRAALSETTYRTIWRSTVADAVAAAEEDPPDLALVDIDLGGGEHGWELIRALRANPVTQSVPIVMLTGSADTLNRERSLRSGADRYLIKPVRPETLRRVTDEMLSVRDDMWWTMTLRTDQAARLRELFFDPTTEVPTLAVVIDDLRS